MVAPRGPSREQRVAGSVEDRVGGVEGGPRHDARHCRMLRSNMETLLPRWEFEDTVERLVDASPGDGDRGRRPCATLRDVPLAAELVTMLRGLPVIVRRRRLPSLDRSFYGDLLRTPGFVELSGDRSVDRGRLRGTAMDPGGWRAPAQPGRVPRPSTNRATRRSDDFRGQARRAPTTRIHLTTHGAPVYWRISLATCGMAQRWRGGRASQPAAAAEERHHADQDRDHRAGDDPEGVCRPRPGRRRSCPTGSR